MAGNHVNEPHSECSAFRQRSFAGHDAAVTHLRVEERTLARSEVRLQQAASAPAVDWRAAPPGFDAVGPGRHDVGVESLLQLDETVPAKARDPIRCRLKAGVEGPCRMAGSRGRTAGKVSANELHNPGAHFY
jgi:hypothetical protein